MTGNDGGRIISFYSYKGGTGRSMMLANLAWVLAENGHRVLVIDWDLEAPGLHRYLHPFLVDQELRSTQGLIDLVIAYSTQAITPGRDNPTGRPWYDELADVTRYAVSLEYSHFPDGATLDLVPAGRQGPAYAARVTSFDWLSFYGRLGGGAFLDEVARRARKKYQYVLIDTRTGVSDTSGICTVQLPDSLVVCFTLNRQSIEGAAAVAESVRAQRPDLRLFPVPMRVELGEKERLDSARDYGYARFAPLLDGMGQRERDDYWSSMEVLYQPYYAYEEVLAPFAERPRLPGYFLQSVWRLAERVTDGKVVSSNPPPETVRQEVLGRYLRRPPEPVVDERESSLLREELARAEAAASAASEALVQTKAAASHEVARSRRLTRWLLAGGAALVVLVAAVVGYLLLAGGDGGNGGTGGDGAAPFVAPEVQTVAVDYGDVTVGAGSSVEIEVKNLLSDPAEVSGVEVGVTDGAFHIDSDECTGVTLADGARCTIRVGFAPTEARAHVGELDVYYEGSETPIAVPLAGNGVG